VENNMTNTNPQWFWNASQNPFVQGQTPQWTPYNAEDNKIIEQHFQSKSSKVELQSHVIHFNERMQVHKTDFHRQRPIKREPKP
jgi:hypothetical protein